MFDGLNVSSSKQDPATRLKASFVLHKYYYYHCTLQLEK